MSTTYHTPHVTAAPLTSAGLNAPLGELDAAIGATRNGPGPIIINGGAFTNTYDTDMWIAGANRTNPVNNAQAIYAQLRITGDAGALVHDAVAAELRLNGISNATFLNALESSVVVTGGANTIPNLRAITANFHTEGAPSGTITAAIMMAAQNPIALTGTIAITTLYGLYVDQMTRGGTNWSVYAPGGVSMFGQVNIAQAQGSATDLRWYADAASAGSGLRWIFRRNTTAEAGANAGSDFEIQARDDTGGSVGTALTITRSNLAIKLGTGPLGFFGTTPVAKKTGWTAATNTKTRTTFDTTTVTLPVLAAHVGALLDDLLAYGLISA